MDYVSKQHISSLCEVFVPHGSPKKVVGWMVGAERTCRTYKTKLHILSPVFGKVSTTKTL